MNTNNPKEDITDSFIRRELAFLMAKNKIEKAKQTISKNRVCETDFTGFFPMLNIAAECCQDNLCVIRCECYILKLFGFNISEELLTNLARKSNILKKEGTPLYNMGRMVENKGLSVTREFGASINDIQLALDNHCGVMVAISGITQFHSVVIIELDNQSSEIVLFDPAHPNGVVRHPIGQFIKEWQLSQHYLVKVCTHEMARKLYCPKPIDVSDISLSINLVDLREAIAENAHNVWGARRYGEGWRYGEERNDTLKTTPCMVPYSDLPDSEKQMDRDMAFETIKFLIKVGILQ